MAVTFLLDALLGAFIPVPINLERGFVFDAIGKMLLVAVAWGLIRLRGERLADIGLKPTCELDASPSPQVLGLLLLFSLPCIFRKRRGFAVTSASSRMYTEIWNSQHLAFSMR